MLKNKMDNVGAVVLAAGKGTRLNCIDRPKVMLEIGNKPIVGYIIETLQKMGFEKENIVLVVGFKKELIKEYLGNAVTYKNQEEQLGTAHAAFLGMKKLPDNIDQVLVLGGDDSAFYAAETLQDFIAKHLENEFVLSLLTTEVDNPSALGRVIRDSEGTFIDVIEKEEITKEQKKIKEISTGTFCFKRDWFENIFSKMKKIPELEEIGLPQAIEVARKRGERMQALKLKDRGEWFGINTLQELNEAKKRKL